jgi:hypothetical protein
LKPSGKSLFQFVARRRDRVKKGLKSAIHEINQKD